MSKKNSVTDHAVSLTPLQLTALAQLHITRFETLIAQARDGRRGVRIKECENLIAVWRQVLANPRWDDLSLDARNEIIDAIESGDYDELLGANLGK